MAPVRRADHRSVMGAGDGRSRRAQYDDAFLGLLQKCADGLEPGRHRADRLDRPARCHLDSPHVDDLARARRPGPGWWWPGDEMDAIARGWRAILREHLPGDERPIAVALPSTPEGVALLVALTSLPPPVILLHPDVRAWRSEPPIPAGTPLVLPPALAHLARDGDKLGLAPTALPGPSTHVPGPPVDAFSGGGIVQFTSGSAGARKPVFFLTSAYFAGVRARVARSRASP